jgi:hypothetical protein
MLSKTDGKQDGRKNQSAQRANLHFGGAIKMLGKRRMLTRELLSAVSFIKPHRFYGSGQVQGITNAWIIVAETIVILSGNHMMYKHD